MMSYEAQDLLALREELAEREAAGLYLLHWSIERSLRQLAARIIGAGC